MKEISITHYIVTLVFFIVTIIITFHLIQSYKSLVVVPGDQDGLKGQKYLGSAIIFGIIIEILIIVGLIAIGILGFRGDFSYVKSVATSITGSEELFVALRIIVFSLLVFTSLVMGILVFKAYIAFTDSAYSNMYQDQINTCLREGIILIGHIILIVFVQLAVFIFGYFYENKGKTSDIPV